MSAGFGRLLKTGRGYGQIGWNGTIKMSHRVSWEIHITKYGMNIYMNKFKVIMIDPPTRFEVFNEETGSGRSPKYEKMDWELLQKLPISDLLEDDAVIFLWATYPSLVQSIELGLSWGLRFSTVGFTFVKLNKNWVDNAKKELTQLFKNEKLIFTEFLESTMQNSFAIGGGYITRANPEICLVFKKGKSIPRKSKAVRNLIVSPIGENSEKPDEANIRIEELYDGPYLEMFARRHYPGWTCMGNHLSDLDIFDEIENYLYQDELMY